MLIVAALAVLLSAPAVLLAAVPLGAGAARLALARRSYLVGGVLHVRGLRHRTMHLTMVRSAGLTTQRTSDALLVLLELEDGAQRLAVPVWRTKSPRGVDPYACDALADELDGGPADAVVPLLRAQGRAVRTGVRPTPLDLLVLGDQGGLNAAAEVPARPESEGGRAHHGPGPRPAGRAGGRTRSVGPGR